MSLFPHIAVSHTIHTLFSHLKWPRSQTAAVKQEFSVSILVRWVHLISVYGFCHCWDALSCEYKRICVRTQQKSSAVGNVGTCVCLRAWLVSICKSLHLSQSNDLETFTHLIHLPLSPPHKSYSLHSITHTETDRESVRDRVRYWDKEREPHPHVTMSKKHSEVKKNKWGKITEKRMLLSPQ